MKVLLSAYACRPNYGTEPGNGWGWATNLAARGVNVHVFTLPENEIWISDFLAREPIENLHFHYVDFPTRFFKGDGTRYASWQWALVKAARKAHATEGFDIVHHVTYGSIHVPTQLWRLGIPVVFGPVGGGQTAPSSMLGYFGPAKRKEQLRTAFTKVISMSPLHRAWLRKMAVILTSNRETLALARRLGRPDASLMFDTAIPNDYPAANPRTFAESTGPLKVLWVGRMLPRKAIGLTLDIFSRVRVPASLTIVGEGMESGTLWHMIEERGLKGRVHWEGKRLPFDQVREAYETHDVLLFNSLRESGGSQLLEAMALGLPIVTLDLHGPGVLVPDGAGMKVAVIAGPQVTLDAAQALDHFAALPAAKKTLMSKVGWEFAQSMTYQSRAEAAEIIYRDVLSGSSTSSVPPKL